MRILKFNSHLTIAFFAAVNHLNGPSYRGAWMYFLVYISLQANNRGLTARESSHIKVKGMLVVSHMGCELQIMVPLRVSGTESHYIYPFMYCLGRGFNKN